MTAVYACVRILSEAVAGLPLHLYRYNSGGSKEKALEHPLYFLLHDEPNPEMTSFAFRETLMTHLLLWGNAYAQIIRNGKGDVVALYPLMPNRMAVDRDKNGNLYYQYNTSSDDARTMKGATVRLSPYEVCILPDLDLTDLSDTRLLQWQRTQSVLPLPPRNTVVSSMQTVRHPAVCLNIRVRLKTRQRFVIRGMPPLQEVATVIELPCLRRD